MNISSYQIWPFPSIGTLTQRLKKSCIHCQQAAYHTLLFISNGCFKQSVELVESLPLSAVPFTAIFTAIKDLLESVCFDENRKNAFYCFLSERGRREAW